METLVELLRKLIPPTRKLLLYSNWSDVDNFEWCLNKTGLTVDELLETKCSTTRDALAYLFNFIPAGVSELDKAISITLQGYVGERLSNTGHVLAIIPYYDSFLLIDSYYSCRGLVINVVDRDKVLVLLAKLQQLRTQFTAQLWQDITGCPYIPDGTEYITVETNYNNFDMYNIRQRFRDLVQETITGIQSAMQIQADYTLKEILQDRKLRNMYNKLSDEKVLYLLSDRVTNTDEIMQWLQELLLL